MKMTGNKFMELAIGLVSVGMASYVITFNTVSMFSPIPADLVMSIASVANFGISLTISGFLVFAFGFILLAIKNPPDSKNLT